ncbi:MAG: hypothetical protein H0V89_09905 [Deltaproteobacteria bacterium]|nr:hypothetical protein [Deltaproteobacteria bacterium]
MHSVQVELLRRAVRDSLLVIGGGYHLLQDGSWVFPGERPGRDWHVHGWLEVRPQVRVRGTLRRIVLRKRRWIRSDRSESTHSRPPDDLGVRFDALLVAVELWCWLDAALGLQRYMTPFEDGPDRRTVQRWLRRATPRARETQQAIRRALIEKSEPRPMEMLFPRGLAPPERLTRRRWKDPSSVTSLWTGLFLLFGGTIGLDLPTAPLLAEARGRLTDPRSRFLL